MSEYSHQQFQELSAELGISDDAREVFTILDSAYRDPSRHYHTHQHIASCLSLLSRFRTQAQRPLELEMAIWFHDAVYDTRQHDNEAQSASWCEQFLNRHQVPSAVVDRVSALILATGDHKAQTEDVALLIDIDLAILGASEAEFEAYDQAIRREYSWVPTDDYRQKRAEVLQKFVDRPAIYHTSDFRHRLDTSARENLSRKISQLIDISPQSQATAGSPFDE